MVHTLFTHTVEIKILFVRSIRFTSQIKSSLQIKDTRVAEYDPLSDT